MKKIYTLVTLIIVLLSQMSVWSQVGVGTTSPEGALDVTSTNDGVLIPRVELTATNSAAPLTTPAISELIYNTATVLGANGVSPGYYYWNGSLWVALSTGKNSDWSLTGNTGTTAGTNFIGTTDPTDLRFKTENRDRLNISNTIGPGQVQSYYNGAAIAPAYSWNGDSNTGIFSPGADVLGLSAGGTETVRINSTGMSIGTAVDPTAKMHLAAGTATSSTAPLKFSNGTNLTTPENGAVEYDGTNYFVTSGGTRYTLAKVLTGSGLIDFGQRQDNNQPPDTQTITVVGAQVGDPVIIGLDNTVFANANDRRGDYQAWVSAPDTVSIRFINTTSTTGNNINPINATFKVVVFRY